MVKAAIIGGRLQGTEAVYLAKKAGFYSVLIDRDENPPARGLCSEFLCLDISEKSEPLINVLCECDFILPATENTETLKTLRQLQAEHNLNIAFDFEAYEITSSKLLSDELFRKNHIPAPRYYPEGDAPYIAKHSGSSGSKGVRLLKADDEFLKTAGSDWVIQEFLKGRAYSIEVIGMPGRYLTYQITEIHVDKNYDCRMVTCPCLEVDAANKRKLSETAIQIAELLQLKGIMDVEAVFHDNQMKILEIDARMPSQTPTTVLHSTGVNLLSELHLLFCGNWKDYVEESRPAIFEYEKAVAYEHIKVTCCGTSSHGEGMMSDCGPLILYENLCGADEVLADSGPGGPTAKVTMVNSAENAGLLDEKRKKILESVKPWNFT